MRPGEYHRGESERYSAFLQIDKELTWGLVSPASTSLFSDTLDGPPDEWVSPEQLAYIDWPLAQTWRRALIEASGIRPRNLRSY